MIVHAKLFELLFEPFDDRFHLEILLRMFFLIVTENP